ncbi:MAG: ABC transporter permease [Acidimicrobiales bacterium]
MTPIPVQYGYWLKDAVQGDLGPTIPGIPVATDIKNRIPITAELTLVAIALAVIVAVPLGILGAFKEGTWIDKLTSAIAQLFLSIPNYVLAIFLGYFISVKLNLLPNSGWNRISNGSSAT